MWRARLLSTRSGSTTRLIGVGLSNFQSDVESPFFVRVDETTSLTIELGANEEKAATRVGVAAENGRTSNVRN